MFDLHSSWHGTHGKSILSCGVRSMTCFIGKCIAAPYTWWDQWWKLKQLLNSCFRSTCVWFSFQLPWDILYDANQEVNCKLRSAKHDACYRKVHNRCIYLKGSVMETLTIAQFKLPQHLCFICVSVTMGHTVWRKSGSQFQVAEYEARRVLEENA